MSDHASRLVKLASDVVDKGVVHLLVVGLMENGKMEMSTSFDRYEDVHALISRAGFEVNMAHAKTIVSQEQTGE